MSTSMNVSLPSTLKDYVRERVDGGDFSTPSDYIRSLIRDDRRRHTKAQLEELLLDGLRSGTPIPAENMDWDDMHRQALALRRRRASSTITNPENKNDTGA